MQISVHDMRGFLFFANPHGPQVSLGLQVYTPGESNGLDFFLQRKHEPPSQGRSPEGPIGGAVLPGH